MGTVTASGRSTRPDSVAAVREAVAEARRGLGGQKPLVGFVFAAPEHDLSAVIADGQTAAGAPLLCCTTAGEITENGLTHGGIAALLVAGDGLLVQPALARDVKAAPAQAAAALRRAGRERRPEAERRGLPHEISVLLVDGLAGTGEILVEEMWRDHGALDELVGGAAGDEGKFARTQVGAGADAASDAAAAVHIFAREAWGIGVDHGLSPSSGPMRVTKARGNVIYELDGAPAFEAYQNFARRRGESIEPEKASSYLINHELGVFIFDKLRKARAPLAVGTDGSLSCAADVPQGAAVAILDGKPDDLVAAAKNAAGEAAERLKGRRAAGVLLFDCICRGTILGKDFGREIEAVRSVFPDVPIAGFLTYGEIARYSGRLDGWHNATAVVAAIPA